MPRKDDVKKNGSKNERAVDNRKYDADSPIESPTFNDISDAYLSSGVSGPAGFIINNARGANDYSDFVRNANGNTDGWFSTIANGIPILKDLHNALLGRDSAKDYLDNNGLGWEDMEGYNDIKLLGRTNSAVSGLAQSGGTYLSNIASDLGKLYSGQKTR